MWDEEGTIPKDPRARMRRDPCDMKTLAEIEAAADALPLEQKSELLVLLAARLRGIRHLPVPRKFSREQIGEWIEVDEQDLRRVRDAR